MGIFDTFKGKQYKDELEALQKEYNSLKELLTPELQDAFRLKQEISRLREERNQVLLNISSLGKIINQKKSGC